MSIRTRGEYIESLKKQKPKIIMEGEKSKMSWNTLPSRWA